MDVGKYSPIPWSIWEWKIDKKAELKKKLEVGIEPYSLNMTISLIKGFPW